ncbi:hypothetical protein DBR46_07300 [Pseudomonas sp. KBW05]|nr:hypothetical protein DBR46_07300 [Pseudomonas sp. KBW05]
MEAYLCLEAFIMGKPLPRLSPPFISADDAARYVHEHIAPSQTAEYGSVILQREADGLFVATLPMAGSATSFDWTLLLDRHGPAADFVHPTGYRIVASLHSHPDTLAPTRRLNPKWSDAQARAFMSFYSERDISFNFKERVRFGVAYLSGPDGALLKYQVQDTPAAAGYVHWLDTQGTWESPHAHDGTLEGAFKKLASVGTLTFLRSSPSWGGSVGQVHSDWQPLQPFTSAPLPLACGPVFVDRMLALQNAWGRLQRQPTLRRHVVILQQTLGERYIASLALPDELVNLPPLPGGFHLHGFYIHSRPLPGNYPVLEAWLYKNFISPSQLAQQIARFRRQPTLGASLFIRLRDEAILRYRFSGSAAESALLNVDDNGPQARLTREFVLQVAQAGELTVEKTSALWDRAGVIKDDWRPYAAWALPTLSQPFLSTDDAARHAHAVIGGRRDRAYAGLILQRRDGRFVVTQPEPAGTDVYPKDRQGRLIILHAGHHLHAHYASRPALSNLEPGEGAREDIELRGQVFQLADVQVPGISYLSGTQDSLLAYQPDTLPAGAPEHPTEWVRWLAANGTLRVLIGNRLWGPAGKVESDWGPYVRALAYESPERLSCGAIFDSADAAAKDLQARPPNAEALHFISRFFAFILKGSAGEVFVATEWVPATQKIPLFSLDDALPEGMVIHARVYSKQWAGNGSTAWLERFFIAPTDLQVAQQASAGKVIYMAPPEGGLLRYQAPASGGVFEQQSGEDIDAKLNAGTLTPLQFVRQVAVAGDLRVIVPSSCWDRSGLVPGLWNPYEHLSRRRLSAAFLTQDDAARYVRQRVPTGLLHFYGGVILRRDDGWFMATEPLEVPDEVFDIKWVFPDQIVTRGLYPVRTNVVACYHSRPEVYPSFLLSSEQATVYRNMFSTRALAQALAAGQERLQHYLLAPDGALISLSATTRVKYPLITAADFVLRPKNRQDWLNGALERRIRSGELTPTEYVNRVADTFTLYVVEGSGLWGGRGQVSGWRPFAPAIAGDARHDPPCTPIFVQPDDAVRHVHAQVTARNVLSFGYLLKSRQNGRYVATLPVPEDGAKFAHRRVFSDAGYLYRHDMAGLYFCVPSDGGLPPGLFSPADLIEALYQVHATRTRGALPLYISCADGALLKFWVRDARFTRYDDLVQLRTRALSAGDYIRRMAAAGDLRLLQASDNWRGHGLATVDERVLALGPMHAHGDDAAWYARRQVGDYGGQQYLSAVLENAQASAWLPVLPVPDQGFPSQVAQRWFPKHINWPNGYQCRAVHVLFHAGLDQPHAVAEDLYREYFVSWRELAHYIHQLTRDGLPINAFYLSARDGALLRYTPGFSDAEYNLLATPGKWSEQGGYTRFAPEPSWVVAELARIGELRVLHAGRFWTRRGAVETRGQQPSDPTPGVPEKDEL